MPMVGFPLLLIPVAIYNMIVFLMPGVTMVEPIAKLRLASGAEWSLTLSDMLLALGITLLMFEVVKGARPGAKYLTDHLLSLVVFGAAAAEFVQWPRFGNSIYFLLALLALVDFLSGVALRARRATQPEAAVSPRQGHRAAMAPEPHFEPTPALPLPALAPPAPSVAAPLPAAAPPAPVEAAAPVVAAVPAVQAAASVAEAVLLERPEPKFLHAEIIPTTPHPQVLSAGLQPVNDFVVTPSARPH